MIKKHHEFAVDYWSEQDQTTYTGQFTSKKLSIMDQSKISVRTSQLCGGMYTVREEIDGKLMPTGKGISEEVEFQNRMIAYLEIALIQKPSWWKLEEITDEGLILEVWKGVMEGEKSFRGLSGTNTSRSRTNRDSEESGDTESKETVARNNVKKVVGKEVSDTLDI